MLVDNWLPNLHVDCVVTDNRGGIIQLVNYLVSQGHEQIASWRPPFHSSLQERYEAYQAALVANGIQPNSDWCWLHTALGRKSKGKEGIEALLERGLPVTAVITDNDNTALGVLHGCGAAGIRVPEDLSLVGFDNVELSEHVNPPLTTVHIHKHHMGKIAARRLHELIQGEDAHVPLRIGLGPSWLSGHLCSNCRNNRGEFMFKLRRLSDRPILEPIAEHAFERGGSV